MFRVLFAFGLRVAHFDSGFCVAELIQGETFRSVPVARPLCRRMALLLMWYPRPASEPGRRRYLPSIDEPGQEIAVEIFEEGAKSEAEAAHGQSFSERQAQRTKGSVCVCVCDFGFTWKITLQFQPPGSHRGGGQRLC